MESPPTNYHRAFAKSPHHVWLGLLTLGAGFLSATPLGLVIGGTAYALGWIYLPDFPFFKRWVDGRIDDVRKAQAQAQMQDFFRKRQSLLDSLSPSRRERYQVLVGVCQNIETASIETPLGPSPDQDPRLRKLDELMWTFLRLLCIEESLERFLETERHENVPGLVEEGEAEVKRLNSEIEALKTNGGGAAMEAKQRLFSSRMERLEVLRKRGQRIQQAQENLALVVSEQDRLDQQIKLIRADAVATKNAETLTARIDATVEHLDQTNKWLAEMDEFKDLVGDLPATEIRVGYQAAVPPVIEAPANTKTTTQQQQSTTYTGLPRRGRERNG